MGTDLHVEKLALHLMCAGTPQGPVKSALTPLLRGYPWKSHIHHAIFNALAAIPSDDPAVLRQLLPAKLTRMGFPDVEWEELFAPQELSSDEALAVVHQLLAGS